MSLSLQKANLWKRISAYMTDFVLAIIVAIGFAVVVSAVLGYDNYTAKLEGLYTEYQQEIGIDFNITEEDFNKLTEEAQADFTAKREAFFKRDDIKVLYSQMFYLTLAILSISILISHLILYFAVPLFFGNGQTLGKKVFGIAVMRTNFTKITNPVLFARSIVGLYAMETMAPVLFTVMIFYGMLGQIGVITIGLIFVLQIIVMMTTKTNSSIHDLLADTVVIDLSSQRIFNTVEEVVAYKTALQAELVKTADTENVTI